MGKLKQQRIEKVLERYETGEHLYENSFPISKSKILVGFPSVDGAGEFTKLLKYMVTHLPKDIRMEELKFFKSLYQDAVETTGWNYRTPENLWWANEDAALLYIAHLPAQTELFMNYGLSKALWEIEYKDSLFGSKLLIAQVEEINSTDKYLIVNSMGLRRRLNMSKIVGMTAYSEKWSTHGGTMKYVLFSFEALSGTARKVSWHILSDDSSATIHAALELPEESLTIPEVEPSEAEVPAEDSIMKDSPLRLWSSYLEKPVSVRLTQDGVIKDYCFVLDHLILSADEQLIEVGSKAISLKVAVEELRLEAIES